jgi:3-methyladenine DNA glycosylase/8-oxoguanine DNA glycosylase
MLLTPSATRLLEVPSYVFHQLGVERKRVDTIHRCAVVAHRLEEAVAMGTEVLDQRLRSLPGVGAWTSAEVRRVALGDADAVSVGDYHVPHMLELLAPFAGHRARVVRLIEAAGIAAPRRGPRMPLRAIARH